MADESETKGVGNNKRPTDNEIKDDFDNVVDELGRVPNSREYNTIGKYSHSTLARHFSDDNSYRTAVSNLGYDTNNIRDNRGKPIVDKNIETDFKNIVNKLGRVPNSLEYRRHGEYSYSTLARHFSDKNSYHDAVSNLGYDTENMKIERDVGKEVSDEELLMEIKNAAELFGEPLHTQEFDSYSKHSWNTYTIRFGSIDEAFKRAGVDKV